MRLAVLIFSTLFAPLVLAVEFDNTLEQSVLRISVKTQTETRTGSGFIIAPGFVLTNHHVVDGARRIQVRSRYVDPALAEIQILWQSTELDLAILRVDDLDLPHVTLATREPRKGEKVRALGYPGSSDFGGPTLKATLTEGVISIFHHQPWDKVGTALRIIQHTAAVNLGNSGGPLFDACGHVLGVNTARAVPVEEEEDIDSDYRENRVDSVYWASHITEAIPHLERLDIRLAMTNATCTPPTGDGTVKDPIAPDEAEEPSGKADQAWRTGLITGLGIVALLSLLAIFLALRKPLVASPSGLLGLLVVIAVAAIFIWSIVQEQFHWQAVQCTNEASVQDYLDNYPVGRYKQQAEDCLADIAARRIPEEVFRDCGQCPEMVVIPAGPFLMGSPSSEGGRDDDEGPQHRVEIAQPFAVGKYEVTFAQWDACRSAGGCSRSPDDEGWGRGNRPVINVSWYDAQEYVVWLSRETGKEYRLLTEAEWEYAARAGTIGPFHFGGTISTDEANYDGNYTYGGGGKGVYREQTVEVGMFPANAFGLHDMHGNVWEWVEDCWHESYAGAPADGSAWTEGGNCGARLLRGGSWVSNPRNLRAAVRDWNSASVRYYFYGLRVVRTLTP